MYLLHARSKIERANVHIADLEGRVTTLERSDAAAIEIHPEHGTEVLTYTLDESAFEAIALVVGDAVHNLRCALDYTWLETITRLVPSAVKDKAKFPINKTIKEVQGEMRKGMVHTVCPDLFNFVVNEIQPCETGNNAIWPIHCFANRDKHRLLIPVLAQGHINGIEVQDKAGEPQPASAISEFQRPRYCIDFVKGLHVTEKGKLTAVVAVQDGKFGCSMDIPQSLVCYSGAIIGVVEAFESFLELKGF